MACCASITLTVQQGECPSNNNNPVPNSMVVVANIDFGTFPSSFSNGQQGFDTTNLPTLALGNYSWTFVSGFIAWNANDYGITCIPEGLKACGDTTGNIDGGGNVTYTSPFHSSVQTIAGQGCSQCGLIDLCDTNALQANTLAINPVLNTQIDSATYGTNMPDITAVLIAGVAPPPDPVGYTLRTSTITWKLTQTTHIFPQPVCISIRDFASVKAAIGTCLNAFNGPDYCAFNPPCVPTIEWDGSFPFRRVLFPKATPDAQVSWYPGDDQAGITPKAPNGPPHTDTCELTLNGMALATTTLLVFQTAVQFRNDMGTGYWQIRITGYENPTGGGLQIWVGTKLTGDTPVGTYTRDPSSCALAPDTLCIEACVPTALTPSSTITTPQLLFGSSAYAQTTDITVRPNLVFFNDQTGLRKIADTTIQAGSTSFGGDVPHHLDYATSTDRVFVSVIAATTYIAVVNPQTMGIDTTFNNGLPYQFNYLKYSPQYDRLVATQSDGTNLHGRIINPNTNSIVGNFTFSTDAANEFQGGIDYHPGLDQIYVARQGNVVTNQSLRIFQGTTFAFIDSLDLGTLSPNDMMFVDEFGKFVVVGGDFNTGAGMIAIVNPGNRIIEHIIMTGTMFQPTSVIYDPQKRLIVADCATVMASVSMLTNTLLGTTPITSVGLSMAFNPTNNKVYHPKAGTNSIDVFG